MMNRMRTEPLVVDIVDCGVSRVDADTGTSSLDIEVDNFGKIVDRSFKSISGLIAELLSTSLDE